MVNEPRRTSPLLPLCFTLALLVGCTKPRTQVLVRLYAEPEVQQVLSSVALEVWAFDGGKWQRRFAGEPVKRTSLLWPLELAVLPKSDADVRFEVIATAFDAEGKPLIYDRAVARFSRQDTRVLELRLRSACLAHPSCGDRSACHGNECLVCGVKEGASVCASAGERSTTGYAPISHGFTEAPPDPEPAEAGAPVDARPSEECSPAAEPGTRASCGPGFACTGNPGARHCADIDECAREPDLCAPGSCLNTEGDFACECPEGFVGTHACTWGRPCDPDTCHPGVCNYITSGLADGRCDCPEGFVDADGRCEDLDECAEGRCGELDCRNTQGSYACQCPGSDTFCNPAHPCRESDAGTSCQGELADWPMPDSAPGAPYPVNREILANDVLRDLVTGLYWYLADGNFYQHELLDACDALEVGGRDDWRIPSAVELMSLADYTRCPPCLSDIGTSFYWTSQRSSFDLAPIVGAPSIGFFERSPLWYSGAYEAWCVSGVPTRGAPRTHRYVAQGELVWDTQTNLVWERTTTASTWEAAGPRCLALSKEGHGDYRLPSPKELYTLMDFASETGRAGALVAVPDATKAWSAQSNGQKLAFALSFREGTLLPVATSEVLEARCVRTGP